MKKLLLFLTAIAFLSSCSSHFSITKRRYNKGFYIASAHKNHSTTQPKSDNKALPTPSDEKVETVVVKAEVKKPTATVVAPVQITPAPVIAAIEPQVSKPSVAAKSTVNPENYSKSASIDLPKSKVITHSQNQQSAADTNTILLVILAILIPCLAVFLKDDKISLLFWITLALQILLVTWIIAMILAILHIMDKL